MHGFEIRTGPDGPTEKPWNRTEIRFFKHKKPDILSSERTEQTGVRLEKPYEP